MDFFVRASVRDDHTIASRAAGLQGIVEPVPSGRHIRERESSLHVRLDDLERAIDRFATMSKRECRDQRTPEAIDDPAGQSRQSIRAERWLDGARRAPRVEDQREKQQP
jgi:hypothetical protein